MASSTLPKLDSLPDLVIDKILGFLPTKTAFQASFPSRQWQWQDVNFNEDDDFERHNLKRYSHYQHQHKRFINFLKGYLNYRDHQHNQKQQLLYKLSLDLRMYEPRDSCTVTKWLKYACHRGLRELEISPKMSVDARRYRVGTKCPVKPHHMFPLPWDVIVGATSLTTLKLEFVRVPFLYHYCPDGLFPSLKTLSFKTAMFSSHQTLYCVLYQCPSIEYLSLTECWIDTSEWYIGCSSLKSLEIKHCWIEEIRVDRASSLESFTFVSLPLSYPRYARCEKMVLNNAFNLKHINIRVDGYLGEFSLQGCHRALKATILTQSVHRFVFSDACLDASVSVISYDFYEATISVGTFLDQEHFLKLMSFLTRFTNCRQINLYNQHVQALIVPRHQRVWNSPPLPKTSTLQVRMPNPPLVGSLDYMELENSLQWIAPIAYIMIKKVNARLNKTERKKVESCSPI